MIGNNGKVGALRLVHRDGTPVQVGDWVESVGGDLYKVLDAAAPSEDDPEGTVYARRQDRPGVLDVSPGPLALKFVWSLDECRRSIRPVSGDGTGGAA